MARSYAQIHSAIWQDSDFKKDLDSDAQWLYFALLSQPNITAAGVLPLQDRRWARFADGMTSERIGTALARLSAYWYVVVDEDTEEVLIRTFIRNDGLWKQPNVLKSALGHVQNTMSPTLRAVLRRELLRLPLEELGPERATKTRTLIERVTETLPETLPEGFLEPPQQPFSPPKAPSGGQVTPPFRVAPENPQVTALEGVAQETLPGTLPEPFPEGSGVGAGVGEGVGEYLAEEEIPKKTTSSSGATSKNSKRGAKKPPSAVDTQAQGLAEGYWSLHQTSTAQSFIAIRQVVKTALANGVDRDQLAHALDLLGREGRPISGGTLQIALQTVRADAGAQRPAVGAYRPFQNPTDPDAYEGW
ncbi:hypothetical protein GCM10027294_43550 [Marinactinospora endophytica]